MRKRRALSRRLATILVALAAAVSLPPGEPVVAGSLPVNPEFLVATDACEETLDRAGELTLSGYAVSATDAGGGLSDVEVSATITNADVGDFARASAIPDFAGTSLDIEADPQVVPMGFGDIAPNGSAPSAMPMTLRLPADQVDDLSAALAAGQIEFVVHARERVIFRPDVYVVSWSSDEDLSASLSGVGVPFWNGQSNEPFDIGEITDPNARVFVIVDSYVPANITDNLLFVEYRGGTWDSLSGLWDVDWAWFDPRLEDIDDLVVSGTFCSETGYDDPSQGRPVRFNDFALGPVNVSGQVAGHLLQVTSSLGVRDGDGRWELGIGIDASLTVQLSAEVDVALDEEATLYEFCLPVASIPIGVTSIPVGFQVEHVLTAQGDASAGLVVGFQKRFVGGYEVGFDTRNAGDEFFSEAFWEPTPVEFTPPRLTDDTGLDIELGTGLEVGVFLGYTCPVPLLGADLHATASIHGGLNVDPTEDPWWSLSHDAQIEAGLDLDILGYGFTAVDAPRVDFPGTETRESSSAGTSSGEDDRWAVAVEFLDSGFGYGDSSVVELADGSAIVSGNSFVASFAPNGELEWSRRFQLGRNFLAPSVFESDPGTIGLGMFDIGGAFLGFIDAADGTLISGTEYKISDPDQPIHLCKLDDAVTFEEGGDRGYVFVGRLSPGSIDYDICAVRLDEAGDVVWAKTLANAGTQYVHDVERTPAGGFAIVGSTSWGPEAGYEHNALLIELEGDGDLAWSKAVVTTTYRADEIWDVTIADDGTWYFTGLSRGTVLDPAALIVGKVAADGTTADVRLFSQDLLWEEGEGAFEPFVDTHGGDTPYDVGLGIVEAPGGVIVSGRTGLCCGAVTAAWALKLGTHLGVEWFGTWDGPDDEGFHDIAPSADGFLASGSSQSLEHLGSVPPAADRAEHLLLMKLPFEGGVQFLPGTGYVARYVAPLDGGFPVSAYNDDHHSGGTILDAPLTIDDADVLTEDEPLLVTATTPNLCVQLLTEPGDPSLTDACAEDDDGDAVLAASDNCPANFNPDQADSDADGAGDACDGFDDADDDGDGIPNSSDACPQDAEDLDGFEDDDGCPEDGPIFDPCTLTPTITGTNVGERIDGTTGDDVIFGLGGNDRIFGNGGDDIICAGLGRDLLVTLGGADFIDGEEGNDTISAGRGADEIHGGFDDDVVRAGRGADVVLGEDGDDDLFGMRGPDQLDGGLGTDTCLGGPGADTIVGCP